MHSTAANAYNKVKLAHAIVLWTSYLISYIYLPEVPPPPSAIGLSPCSLWWWLSFLSLSNLFFSFSNLYILKRETLDDFVRSVFFPHWSVQNKNPLEVSQRGVSIGPSPTMDERRRRVIYCNLVGAKIFAELPKILESFSEIQGSSNWVFKRINTLWQ